MSLSTLSEADYYEGIEPESAAVGNVVITATGERLLLRGPLAGNGPLLSCERRRVVTPVDNLFGDALRSLAHRVCCRRGEEYFKFANRALRASQKLCGESTALWQTRWIGKRNDLFERGQQLSKCVIRLPSRKDHRRKSVFN